MNKRQPPTIATWILHHLTPGQPNESLHGDLLEELQNGRSSAWYWRQVMTALAFATAREMRAHWPALTFAALWAVMARTWWHFVFWSAAHRVGLILPWPYSIFLGTAAIILESLWAGLGVYVWLYALLHGDSRIDGFARAFWLAPSLYFTLTIAIKIIAHPLGIRLSNLDALHPVIYCLSFATAAWGVRVIEPNLAAGKQN
jgi:hypothetical protein